MAEQVATSRKDFSNVCWICFKSGNVSVTEQLPYGQAMSCTHDDQKIHTWTKYNSLDSLGRRGALSTTGKPVTIICPKCNKKGTVNYYRPNADRTDRFVYVVRHERIKGTWGKTKIKKVRRCYIQDKDQKEQVKIQLDKKRGKRN